MVARDRGERSWPARVRRAEAEAAARAREELEAALADGDAVRVRAALAAGADPRRTQALATVLEREDPDTVALVLDHLPERSGERAWALLWAVQHGRSEQIIRLLVERGAALEAYDEGNDRRPYLPLSWGSHRSGLLMARLT